MQHSLYYAHYSAAYLCELFNINMGADTLFPYLTALFGASTLHPAYILWALILLTRYRGRHLNRDPVATAGKAKQAFTCAYYLAARTAKKGYRHLSLWREAAEELNIDEGALPAMSDVLEQELGGWRMTDVTGTELCNMRKIIEKEVRRPREHEQRVSWWPREEQKYEEEDSL